MITEIVAPIVTGVSVSLIVFFVTRYFASTQAKKSAEIERKETERAETAKRNSEKIDDLTDLTMAMAQHKIVTIGNAYIKQGVVTANEVALIKAIYEPYHKRGGNGIAKEIVDEVDKLPFVADDGGKHAEIKK